MRWPAMLAARRARWQPKQVLNDKEVLTTALNTFTLTSRKNVNLPGTAVDLPSLSEKDIDDLGFAVKHNLDMIFASFMRDSKGVEEMKAALGDNGKHIKIISKIENQQGIKNFDEILAVTDGVMVARGTIS